MSTVIGKTLVIVITSLALLFLGISTVAYSTARDWTKAVSGERSKLEAIKKKLQALKDEADKSTKGLDDAKAALAAETKNVNTRLAAIKETNKQDLEKITAVKDQVLIAQDAAKKILDEVQAKRQQIARLHHQQETVDKEAKDFRLYESQLTDRIRELERILQTAAKNKADLHKRPSGKFSAMLR